MMHRYAFEAVDRTLKDILGKDNRVLEQKTLGELAVVLCGDFRQILPVVPGGTKHDIIHVSISRSKLWAECKVYKLTQNMRVQQSSDHYQGMIVSQFSKWILDIGNGDTKDTDNEIEDANAKLEIPEDLILHKTHDSIEGIVSSTYPDYKSNNKNLSYVQERAILTPRNETVDIANDVILDIVDGEATTYLTSDSISSTSPNMLENQDLYPIEFLNSIKFPEMPNFEIKLKVGTPIMLLRNLSPTEGLCNGTRLIVTQLLKWVIKARIINGTNIGTKHFISQSVTTNTDSKWPFHMKRKQFPIRPCYAMTINKSQGQTLKYVGLYLPKPCFTHGQLYVAVSRVTTPKGIKILIDSNEVINENITDNVVYREIFNNLEEGIYAIYLTDLE